MSRMIAILIFSITTLAAMAATNVVAKVEKGQRVASANVCVMPPVASEESGRELMVVLKEAIVDAKAEYKERYKELKDAHDRFMDQLNISIMVLTVFVSLFGVLIPYLKQKRFAKEINGYRNSLSNVQNIGVELKKSQAKSSLNMMKFVWVEFLRLVKCGGAGDRDIAQPLYRMVEALTFANQLGDEKFLKMCVRDVVQVIDRYRDVLNGKDDLEEKFKAFMKEHRICTESADFYDLAQTMAGNNTSIEKVLKFLNEFGITMFGEVGG